MFDLFVRRLVSAYLILLLLLVPCAQGFTDVHPHQKVHGSVQYFVDKGVLDDRGAFSADKNISKGLFWKLVMSEVGAKKDDPVRDLPSGVTDSNVFAPYLSKAVELKLIEARIPFNPNGFITQGQAVKGILASKGIKVPTRVSPSFRNKVTGISRRSSYLRYLEAAYASKILEKKDFQPFSPHKKLTRRKAGIWLHNFVQGGEVKESTTNPSRYSTKSPNRRGLRTRSQGRRSSTTSSSGGGTRTLTIPDGKTLEAVYAAILDSYRFADELTEDKKRELINAAIKGMVEALGDKYSSYIQPKNVKKFQSSLDGDFEGIGAFVDIIEGKFTIVSPIKGSPAEEAGLEAGDVVTHVEGEDISDAVSRNAISEITAKIKGKAGTSVKLTIQRETRSFEVNVTRGKIKIPAINLEWHKSVPVLGIHQFNRDTGVKLRTIIETEILPKNPKGLVLDLRNNPGGYLVAAVQVGEIFLREGNEIFSVEYTEGKQPYTASRTGPLVDMDNIVVLQNKGSASASEIVEAMLQDYDRAEIIGTNSLGKGTVQNISNYQNGGLLKLTVAKWLSPKGRWIHDKGVPADIEMEAQTVEERRAKVDKPRDRAVQYILGNR